MGKWYFNGYEKKTLVYRETRLKSAPKVVGDLLASTYWVLETHWEKPKEFNTPCGQYLQTSRDILGKA
jgi:hypothetical protein